MQLRNKLDYLLASTADMSLRRRAETIITQLDLKNGDRILEVGCGAGYYLYLLSNLGIQLELVGIDIDDKGLATAKRYLTGKKARLIKADVMVKLPFASNYFDKILLSEVLEHLPDDKKALVNIRRVLKKNGILAITVPNYYFPVLWDPINWFLQEFFGKHITSGFWAGIWNQHIRLYKPNEVESVVRKSGFRILKKKCLTFWSLPFNHYVLNYAARLLDQNKFPKVIAGSVNKFRVAENRPAYISLAFTILELVDKLNEVYMPKNHGVAIFFKSREIILLKKFLCVIVSLSNETD